MSSQAPDPIPADPGAITFELEQLVTTEPGQLDVSGRWFGIRGRRFVRPTLTLAVGGNEQRSLAELEHKPWAAQDGELWVAAFRCDVKPADASRIELSVAPDITVELHPPDGSPGAKPPTRTAAPAAQAPVVRADPALQQRPAGRRRAREAERLNARLAGADEALERERARRSAADQALEEQRAEVGRLRAELGRLRAQLELTNAAQLEAESAAAELDGARKQSFADRAELTQARADSERLRASLQRAETAGRHRPSPETTGRPRTEPDPDSHPSRGEPQRRLAPPSRPEPDRPLNPSLRHATNWIGRVVALLFMLLFIAAVVLVIRTSHLISI